MGENMCLERWTVLQNNVQREGTRVDGISFCCRSSINSQSVGPLHTTIEYQTRNNSTMLSIMYADDVMSSTMSRYDEVINHHVWSTAFSYCAHPQWEQTHIHQSYIYFNSLVACEQRAKLSACVFSFQKDVWKRVRQNSFDHWSGDHSTLKMGNGIFQSGANGRYINIQYRESSKCHSIERKFVCRSLLQLSFVMFTTPPSAAWKWIYCKEKTTNTRSRISARNYPSQSKFRLHSRIAVFSLHLPLWIGSMRQSATKNLAACLFLGVPGHVNMLQYESWVTHSTQVSSVRVMCVCHHKWEELAMVCVPQRVVVRTASSHSFRPSVCPHTRPTSPPTQVSSSENKNKPGLFVS